MLWAILSAPMTAGGEVVVLVTDHAPAILVSAVTIATTKGAQIVVLAEELVIYGQASANAMNDSAVKIVLK